jgi:hypothetical protein
MRIEPPQRSLPRQPSGRRHRAEALQPGKLTEKRLPANNKTSQNHEATIRQVESVDIVSINAPDYNATGRLSPKRWRSHVPFIAQYIGQETAMETPERRARRHSEPARKAYQKRTSLPPSPRTVAHI